MRHPWSLGVLNNMMVCLRNRSFKLSGCYHVALRMMCLWINKKKQNSAESVVFRKSPKSQQMTSLSLRSMWFLRKAGKKRKWLLNLCRCSVGYCQWIIKAHPLPHLIPHLCKDSSFLKVCSHSRQEAAVRKQWVSYLMYLECMWMEGVMEKQRSLWLSCLSKSSECTGMQRLYS